METTESRKELPSNIVLVGDKEIINYAVATNSTLLKGQTAILKARGAKVVRIFDTIEFLKNRFGVKAVIDKVISSSENLVSQNNTARVVTALEVHVKIEEVKKEEKT